MNIDFWGNILLVRKTYGRLLEVTCRRWGLTRAEMDVLLFLSNSPGRDRAADVVEFRGLTKSHVSVAVNSLCEQGMLETRQDENDRRVVHLTLTDRATAAVAEGKATQQQFFQKLFAGFTPEEWQAFLHINNKMVDNLSQP